MNVITCIAVASLDFGLSDHQAQKLEIVGYVVPKSTQKLYFTKRNTSPKNISLFKLGLESFDWSVAPDNFDEHVSYFLCTLSNQFNIHCPLVKRKIKNNNNKTWISDEIIKLHQEIIDFSKTVKRCP